MKSKLSKTIVLTLFMTNLVPVMAQARSEGHEYIHFQNQLEQKERERVIRETERTKSRQAEEIQLPPSSNSPNSGF